MNGLGEERVIPSINRVGYPFQRRIAKEIGDAGWRVDFEHDTRFFTEFSEELRAKVDILASLGMADSPAPKIASIVECKRRDPKHVSWLFFSRAADTTGSVGSAERCDVVFCAPDKVGKDGVIYGHKVEYITLTLNEIGNCRTVYDYYLQRKSENDVKPDDIEGAFRQVAVGLRGVIRNLYTSRETGNGMMMDVVPRRTALLPVVVTTAPILACSFKDGQVDISEGIIKSNEVEQRSLPWILCSYKLPYELQFYDLRTLAGNQHSLDHLDIWVVRSSSTREFYEKMKKDAESSWDNDILKFQLLEARK